MAELLRCVVCRGFVSLASAEPFDSGYRCHRCATTGAEPDVASRLGAQRRGLALPIGEEVAGLRSPWGRIEIHYSTARLVALTGFTLLVISGILWTARVDVSVGDYTSLLTWLFILGAGLMAVGVTRTRDR